MPQIDKVAFFGDSYCFDTVTRKHHRGTETAFYPPDNTYLDIFAQRYNLEIVKRGTPAHGPHWMVHEFREWCKEQSQEYINQTHFVFLWSDQTRQIMQNVGDKRDRGNKFEDEIHPGERSLPGPDTPYIQDPEYFDENVRLAIELTWLYIKSDPEFFRQYTTCRDAHKFYLQQFGISNMQQYHCFYHTAEFDNNCFAFEHNGETHNCLQQFAVSHSDYVRGENQDLMPSFQDHFNHFSPTGQFSMADVLSKKFEELNV